MRIMKKGRLIGLRSLIIIVASLLSLLVPLTSASSEETYKFERMWPTLQQPWSFSPTGIAIDAGGNVYIPDGNQMIHKLTANGQSFNNVFCRFYFDDIAPEKLDLSFWI